jgi:hypothetical protein
MLDMFYSSNQKRRQHLVSGRPRVRGKEQNEK